MILKFEYVTLSSLQVEAVSTQKKGNDTMTNATTSNNHLQQDICDSCQQVTGVRFFPNEDVWHCEDCQAYDLDLEW